jgi:phosphatidylglycerol:prolipoprotein diacylglycerol transferase
MIFTRVGCLLNGCCAGRPSDSWCALFLPDAGGHWERRMPTQLLEAGWATLLLVSSVLIWPRLPFDGALFLFVSAGYAAGRLGLESMRDGGRSSGSFTVHHGISVFIILAAATAILWRKIFT